MRFEARELKPHAEPVTASALITGEVYFSVQFVDREGLIPIMETLVFVGRNLDPDDTVGERLYFQDVESYRKGIRCDSSDAENAIFYAQSQVNHILEYDHALDELLECFLRGARRKEN
jgi:hypothetical protein